MTRKVNKNPLNIMNNKIITFENHVNQVWDKYVKRGNYQDNVELVLILAGQNLRMKLCGDVYEEVINFLELLEPRLYKQNLGLKSGRRVIIENDEEGKMIDFYEEGTIVDPWYMMLYKMIDEVEDAKEWEKFEQVLKAYDNLRFIK